MPGLNLFFFFDVEQQVAVSGSRRQRGEPRGRLFCQPRGSFRVSSISGGLSPEAGSEALQEVLQITCWPHFRPLCLSVMLWLLRSGLQNVAVAWLVLK